MTNTAVPNGLETPWYRDARMTSPVFLVVFLVLSALVLVSSYYSINHNDFMYAPSAFTDGALYEDVHYLQTPVGYWILKSLAATLDTGFKYYGLRLYSVVFVLASVFIACRTLLDTTGQRLLFMGIVATSPYVFSLALEIGTYSMSLLLVTAAYAVIYGRWDRPVYGIVSGLLIGFSVGTKLSHVLFLIPPGLYILLQGVPNLKTLIVRQVPLGLGFLLGLVPTLYYVLATREAFILHNLIFHTEFSMASNGFTDPAVMFENLTEELWDFTRIHAPFLLMAVAVLVHVKERRPEFHFLLSAVIIALAVAIAPRILYDQYLGPAAFFVAVLFAKCAWLPDRRLTRTMLIVSIPLVVYLSGRETVPSTVEKHVRGETDYRTVSDTIEKLNAASLAITPDKHGCSNELFTYAGALALDTRFRLADYTEAGIAWRRQRGFVDPKYTADPAYGLDENLLDPLGYIDRAQIGFFLVGWYPKEEADLVEYASRMGFGEISLGTIDGKDLRLLYRQGCLAG